MKKIIFLLLLAQTISFLYADSACQRHSYRWGIKSPEHTQCYCNCAQYAQPNNKCIQCGHHRVPTDLKISTPQPAKTNTTS